MPLEEITFTLFAACNSLRVLAYLPQIHKAAVDQNGASAISGTTWSLFLLAHASTIAYALVNRSDLWLALCFAGNALCCAVILAIVLWKGRDRASSVRGRHSVSYIESVERRPKGARSSRQVHDQYRNFSRAVLMH
jgi:hypothetical protein